MKSKRKVYILVTLALVGFSVCGLLLSAASQRPQAFDSFEVANSELRMRVTAYHENIPYSLPGARYVFQSAAVGSEDWHEIMTFKADEAIPIPREQIRFVSDQVGYIFIGNYYAVTTDSGRTWFVWDANKEVPVKEFMEDYNLWPAIKDVQLESTGAGKMTLMRYLSDRKKGPDLVTSDFGKHWATEK